MRRKGSRADRARMGADRDTRCSATLRVTEWSAAALTLCDGDNIYAPRCALTFAVGGLFAFWGAWRTYILPRVQSVLCLWPSRGGANLN